MACPLPLSTPSRVDGACRSGHSWRVDAAAISAIAHADRNGRDARHRARRRRDVHSIRFACGPCFRFGLGGGDGGAVGTSGAAAAATRARLLRHRRRAAWHRGDAGDVAGGRDLAGQHRAVDAGFAGHDRRDLALSARRASLGFVLGADWRKSRRDGAGDRAVDASSVATCAPSPSSRPCACCCSFSACPTGLRCSGSWCRRCRCRADPPDSPCSAR